MSSNSVKQTYYETLANTVIKNLAKRRMEGYYCPTIEDAEKKVFSFLDGNCTVSFGGSMTLEDTGLLTALRHDPNIRLIDRATAKSPEEARQIFAKSVLADYYLMSTNAITLDGELINIDGNGNRVACLIQGPKQVFIIAGMNKVVTDIGTGLSRVQNIATPPNTLRLNKKTPCTITGSCANCLSPDCICNQIVITRRSGHVDRIKVFLVGENLGF